MTSGTDTGIDPCLAISPDICDEPGGGGYCGCVAPFAECETGYLVQISGFTDGNPEWFIAGDWSCILAYFASSSPALIEVEVTINSDANEGSYADRIVLLGDGTAVFSRSDLDEEFPFEPSHEWHHVTVRPPPFFAPCIDTQEAQVAVQCLLDWYDADLCTPVECCPVSTTPDIAECE